MANQKPKLNQKECDVCKEIYEAGRSKCPACGTPNKLFESDTYIRIELEIEKRLYRAIETCPKAIGQTIPEFIEAAIEEKIMKQRRRING